MIKLNVKRYITIIAVIALLFFLHYAELLNPVESFLNRHLSPVFAFFYNYSSGLNQTYLNQTKKADLAAELKAARQTINQLTAEQAKVKFLEEENSALRQQLNFLNESGWRYLMANVISRGDPNEEIKNSQPLVIDKGRKDGLSAGLAVVSAAEPAAASQGVIIGKIANVKDSIAEIFLITDKNCKIAAAILGEKKTIGIARGELGLTVKMDFIPQTENIKIGDLAATSGLEQNIPRGLVIGRVLRVEKENNQVWQSAAIEPLISLDSLSVVSVLLP